MNQENTFIKGKNFWISYNPSTDTGKDETALCQDKIPHYLILNGNYLEQYRPLVKKGYKACKELYDKLLTDGAEKSKWSE